METIYGINNKGLSVFGPTNGYKVHSKGSWPPPPFPSMKKCAILAEDFEMLMYDAFLYGQYCLLNDRTRVDDGIHLNIVWVPNTTECKLSFVRLDA